MGSPSALRAINDRAALYALLHATVLTTGDLEDMIDVSKPTASDLLRRLEESGLVRRAGFRVGGPGPQAQLWSLNGDIAFAAGVDVNESGLDIAVADIAGLVRHEAKYALETGEDPVRTLRDRIHEVASQGGIDSQKIGAVVVGISASVDPITGLLSHGSHIPSWLGFDVQGRLSVELDVPVSVENDVNLVATDELFRGRAIGCRDVLLLWMSGGVATAVISGGRLHRGSRGSAGEFDYIGVAPGGPLFTNVLSARGILELADECGLREKTLGELLAHAVSGSTTSEKYLHFLELVSQRIADALAAPVSLLDPELVILAGDVGLNGGEELARRVQKHVHSVLLHRPRIVPGTGYEKSVRQGALDAALRQLRDTIFGGSLDREEGPGPGTP